MNGILIGSGIGNIEQPVEGKTHLLYGFPAQKKKIAKLSYDEKMEWYAHQFSTPYVALDVLSTKEFKRFWYWNVILPVKIKRMLYRIKNFQFKKHEHITEMKKKAKLYSI